MTERERKIKVGLGEHHSFITKQYPEKEFIGTFVQGSQNYLLDYEDSDIDTRSIVIPTMKEIVYATNPISTVKIMDNDEHCDVKDVRHFFKILKKCNIQFAEILFTEYSIINQRYKDLWDALVEKREEIARYNEYALISAIQGMAMEKYHSLEHPYPSIVDKIEKYGYDPKQLHHLFRLYLVLLKYIKGASFKECLILPESERKELIEIKRGKYALYAAREMANEYMSQIDFEANRYKRLHGKYTDDKVEQFLDEICYEMVKRGIEFELFKERR